MAPKDETKIAKAALAAAGIDARVRHGHGTACCWLHVYLEPSDGDCAGTYPEHRPSDCPKCTDERKRSAIAIKIVQAATGRYGQYDGEINVYINNPFSTRPAKIQ